MKAFVPSSVSKASRTEGTWTLVPQANQTLPAGLDGHVLIVAPLPPPEDRPQRGERAFPNGDGLIYRLSFENGTAKLTTAIAKTPCYYADLASQYDERYKSLAFRNGGVVRMSLALGSRNQLNTAFLKTNRRLLITYDAGRPYTLDPQTLEIVEPIGATQDWIMIFAGLLPISNIFRPYSGSAHPVCVPPKQPNSKQEPDEGFIVNYSSGYNGKFKVPVNRFLNRFFKRINQIKLGRKLLFAKDKEIDSNEYWGSFTDLIRYKSVANADQMQPEYKVERWRLQLSDGQPVVIKQSVHQMGITEKFVILGDLQFGLEYSQIFSPFFLSFIWSRGFSRLSHWIKNPLGEWLYSVFLQLLESTPFTDFYLIRRDQLDDPKNHPSCQADQPPQPLVATKISLPRTVSHFAVDYADSEKLVFHIGHHNGLDPTEWINQFDRPVTRQPGKDYLRKDLQGLLVGTTDLGSFARYEFEPETSALLKSESVSDPGLDDEPESNSSLPAAANTWLPSVYTHRDLYDQPGLNTVQHVYWMSWGFSWELIPQRIYDAYRDREYREIPLEQLPSHDVPPTLLCVDTTAMTIADAYVFPEGYAAYSPQFVPSSVDAQNTPISRHGFIVCVVLSDDPDNPEQPNDEFWIFDANCLYQGPLCKLHSPEQRLNLGATLHSTWLSTAEFAAYQYSEQERLARREQSVKQDYEEAVVIAESQGKQRIKDLFETVIYPHFIGQTSEAELVAQLKHSIQHKSDLAGQITAPSDGVSDGISYTADISPAGLPPEIAGNGTMDTTNVASDVTTTPNR